MTVHKQIKLANGSILEFKSNVGATPKATIDGKEVPYKDYLPLVYPNGCKR